MTQSWHILRTALGREFQVEAEIQSWGYDAWCPGEVRITRPAQARRQMTAAHVRKPRTVALLPGCLFAALPGTAIGKLWSLRYDAVIQCDSACSPYLVPFKQLQPFREKINRLNAATLAGNSVQTAAKKAQWQSYYDGLTDLARATTATPY